MADVFAAILDRAGSRFLALDPDTAARVARLQGKVIQINCTGPRFDVFLLPLPDGIQIRRRCATAPDVVLRGSLATFVKLGLNPNAHMVGAGELEIDGDIELGQRFQRLVGKLDIDWEEQASRVAGDVIAHRLGNIARGASRWIASAFDTAGRDAAEYFQYERRSLIPRRQVDAYIQAVDALREDADRLTARIQRLQEPQS